MTIEFSYGVWTPGDEGVDRCRFGLEVASQIEEGLKLS